MNEGYMCCLCGKVITKEDYAALHLIATNLWEREAAQSVFSHSHCAETRMAFGQISPDSLLEGNTGHSVQEIIWGEDQGRRTIVPRWGCFVAVALIFAALYLLIRALGS